MDNDRPPKRIWKLIPVKVDSSFVPSSPLSENLGSGSLPSYDGDATGQSSTRARHVEFEQGELGTIVDEVTIVTTHKRYRAGDA